MKEIIAYTSDDGSTVYQKKSEALAKDAAHCSRQIAAEIAGEGSDAAHTIARGLSFIADRGVSPRKLRALYGRLWRVRNDFLQAIRDEQVAVKEDLIL